MIQKIKTQLEKDSSEMIFFIWSILVGSVELVSFSIFLVANWQAALLTLFGLFLIAILFRIGINKAIIRNVRRMKRDGCSDYFIESQGTLYTLPLTTPNDIVALCWYWFIPTIFFTYVSACFPVLWIYVFPSQSDIVKKELARLNAIPELEAGDQPYRTIKEKHGAVNLWANRR